MPNIEKDVLETAGNQKYLGNTGLIVLLGILSAFVPLSTDIYLPALPAMTSYFSVPQSIVNLTLILFFVFFALGTLFWGPFSDKYGRKPILLIGLIMYVIASVLCAASLSVYLLILFRALQAFGGSAASVVATAIVKDVYSGKKRESVLALVQSMVVISPACAPVLGAVLLRVTSWRGVFLVQMIIGCVALAGAFALQETIRHKSSGTVIRTIGRLGVVLRNPDFTSLLITFSMISISTMAFISSSSYIFQNSFKLSREAYGVYFAFNSMGMILGPLLYIGLSNFFKRNVIINLGFAVMAVSGLMVCVFGDGSPWLFAVALFPATIAGSCIRPPGVNLMLEQQKENTGSVSSLITSFTTIMGSIGIIIVSFDWRSQIVVVGALTLLLGIISGCAWLYISNQPDFKQTHQQF